MLGGKYFIFPVAILAQVVIIALIQPDVNNFQILTKISNLLVQSNHVLRVLTQASMDTNLRQLEGLRQLQHNGRHLPEMDEYDDPDDPEDIFPELEELDNDHYNAHTDRREPDDDTAIGWNSYYRGESAPIIDLDQTFVTNFCNTTPGATTKQWIIHFRKLCMLYRQPRDAVRVWFEKFEPFCNQEKIKQLVLSDRMKIELQIAWQKQKHDKPNGCRFDFSHGTIISTNGSAFRLSMFTLPYRKASHENKFAKMRWDLGVLYSGALDMWRQNNNFDSAASHFNVAANELNQNLLQKLTKPILTMTQEERDSLLIPLASYIAPRPRRQPQMKSNHQHLFINYADCMRYSPDEYPIEIREDILLIKQYLRVPGNSLETMKNTPVTKHLYKIMCDHIRKENEQSIIFHGDCKISPSNDGFFKFVSGLFNLLEIQNRRTYSIETLDTLELPTIIIGEKKSLPSTRYPRALDQPIIRCPHGKCSIDRNGVETMTQCQKPINLKIGGNFAKLSDMIEKVKKDDLSPNTQAMVKRLKDRINNHMIPHHGRKRKSPQCPRCATINSAPNDVVDNFDKLCNLNETIYPTRIECNECDLIYCSSCFQDHFSINPTVCRGVDVSFGQDSDFVACPSCDVCIRKVAGTCSVIQCSSCNNAFCIGCMCMRSHLHPDPELVPMDDIVRRHFCKIVHVYPSTTFSATELALSMRLEEGMWRVREDGMVEYDIYQRHHEWVHYPNDIIPRKIIMKSDEIMIRAGH